MDSKELLYTDQHEWVRREGDVATVGITDHAQEALGDITFVELPSVGKELAKGAEACTIESAKAAAGVYAPADGKVIEANSALDEDPSLINSDPCGRGWIYKMQAVNADDLAGLMNAQQYDEFLKTAT